MLDKIIEKLEEEIRYFETKEGKAEYEKKVEEKKALIDKMGVNVYLKSYEEELQEKKTKLAELKRMVTFAMVKQISVNSAYVLLDDGWEYSIPLDEFAVYGPKIGNRVGVNVAGSKAHIAIFSVFYANDVSASEGSFILPLPYGEKLHIHIPYSRFGTSRFIDSADKNHNRVDVFCVDGEYYPAPSFLKKIHNATTPNPHGALQKTLEDILFEIRSGRMEK